MSVCGETAYIASKLLVTIWSGLNTVTHVGGLLISNGKLEFVLAAHGEHIEHVV